MSTVMRPSGPLPPRVYWTRRLVLLAMILLVTVLLGWLVSAAGDANETTASDVDPSPPRTGPAVVPATTNPTPTPKPVKNSAVRTPTTQTPSPSPSPSPAPAPSTTPAPPTTTTAKTEPGPEPARPTVEPLAEPTGDCDPAGVDMAIDVADVKAGRSNAATFLLTSTDTAACTLSVTPATLLVNVTSGADIVWSSDDCPDALLAKQIVVRSDPPSSYEFTWNGSRSSEGCLLDDAKPDPGGYWVEAALIGGEPHKAYFDIT